MRLWPSTKRALPIGDYPSMEKWANRERVRRKRAKAVPPGVHVGVSCKASWTKKRNRPGNNYYNEHLNVSHLDIPTVVYPSCYKARCRSIPIPYVKGRLHKSGVLRAKLPGLANFYLHIPSLSNQGFQWKSKWDNTIWKKVTHGEFGCARARHLNNLKWKLARTFGGHPVLFPGNKCGPTWEGCTEMLIFAQFTNTQHFYEVSQVQFIHKCLGTVNKYGGCILENPVTKFQVF